MIDLSSVFLPVSTVSEGLGLKPATVSQWIAMGLIGGPGDQMAPVPGATTFLGLETAMAVAIAAELRKFGASREIACKAGKAFAAIKVPASGARDRTGEYGSWIIVDAEGEISPVSVKKGGLANAAVSGWHLHWPPLAAKVVQLYANHRADTAV